MLSAFLGAVTAIGFVYLIYSEIDKCLAARQPNLVRRSAIGMVCDTAIATMILWTQTRFLAAITRLNWGATPALKSARLMGPSIRIRNGAAQGWKVIPRIVAGVLIFAVTWSFGSVLAFAFLGGILGLEVGTVAMVGLISGLCTGGIVGVRVPVFGAAFGKFTPGEVRMHRTFTILGTLIGVLLFLGAAIVPNNGPVGGVLPSPLFAVLFVLLASICGCFIGMTVGVIVTSLWRGCRAIRRLMLG